MAADVKLRISASKKSGSSWYSALSLEGNKYYYKFTGGNTGANNGNQQLNANGNAKSFDIRLLPKTNNNYRLTALLYRFNDTYSQLSGVLNADNTYTVTDLCTHDGPLLCGVYLYPVGNANDLFLCDPRIINILSR